MISGIVLAAGASSRFGRTKQIVEVRGKPLVQHAIDAATRGALDEVIVVVGHDAERVRAAVRLPSTGRFVMNDAFASGQASSLRAGLEAAAAGSVAAVVLLADQPGVSERHVRMLVEAFEARRSPIVRLRFRSGPGPSLLAREVWRDAVTLDGDVGARALIEHRPDLVEDVDVGGDAPLDVDTPGDLEHA